MDQMTPVKVAVTLHQLARVLRPKGSVLDSEGNSREIKPLYESSTDEASAKDEAGKPASLRDASKAIGGGRAERALKGSGMRRNDSPFRSLSGLGKSGGTDFAKTANPFSRALVRAVGNTHEEMDRRGFGPSQEEMGRVAEEMRQLAERQHTEAFALMQDDHGLMGRASRYAEDARTAVNDVVEATPAAMTALGEGASDLRWSLSPPTVGDTLTDWGAARHTASRLGGPEIGPGATGAAVLGAGALTGAGLLSALRRLLRR